MKRIIIPLALCIALCGCADAKDNPGASAPADVLPEKTATTAETPALATEESASEVIPEPLSEQERLIQLILETRGTEPISEFNELAYPPESYALSPVLFGDFDGNGKEEIFAVYGCESGYADALCAVQNILLFDNGIICVNYTRDTYQNLFRRYSTDGAALTDITPEENYGQYLPLSPNG